MERKQDARKAVMACNRVLNRPKTNKSMTALSSSPTLACGDSESSEVARNSSRIITGSVEFQDDWEGKHRARGTRTPSKAEAISAPGGPPVPRFENVKFDGDSKHQSFEKKDTKAPLMSVEKWTCEELGEFIRGLGAAKCWERYAQLCTDEEIDGSTIADASLEMLEAVGFNKIHANKILAALRRKFAPKKTLTPGNGYDKKARELFSALFVTMDHLEGKVTNEISRAQSQHQREMNRIQKQFNRMVEHLHSERGRLQGDLEGKLAEVLQPFQNHLNSIKKNRILLREKEAEYMQNPIQLPQRSLLFGKVKQVQDMTERLPRLQHYFVEYRPAFESLTDKKLGDLRLINDLKKIQEMRPSHHFRDFVDDLKADEFHELPSMYDKRRCFGFCASKDGRLFAVGGLNENGKSLDTVEMFNFEEKKWAYLPPMNTKRSFLSACLSPNGDKLYAVGGYDGVSNLASAEYFDFNLNRWIMLPSMSTRRGSLATTVMPDGKVVAIGGFGDNKRLDTVEFFDWAEKKWIMAPKMNSKRSKLGASVSIEGDAIYAVGGWDGEKNLETVERLSLETQTWDYIQPMSKCRSFMGTCFVPGDSMNNRLIVVGGTNGAVDWRSAESYTPCTGSWSSLPPMHHRRFGLGAVGLDSTLIVAGGCDDEGDGVLNTVELLRFSL